MPGLCKFLRLAQLRIVGQRANHCTYLGLVGRGRAVNRAVCFRFEQHVDEGAPLEISLTKPAIKNVENCQEPLFWLRYAALDFRLEPPASPQGFTPVQESKGEINLGLEIAVKTGLCTTRFGQRIVSMPTWLIPLVANKSSAASRSRSRGVIVCLV